MGNILKHFNYLRKGIVDQESRREKDKFFWTRIQIVTAFNLIAELLDIFLFDHIMENNLDKAKTYIASQNPGL